MPSWRSAWPSWAALLIVVLAAAGIGLSYLFRPADERGDDSTKVQYAINAYYTARNNVDYSAYRDATCAATRDSTQFPSESNFETTEKKSLEDNGRVVIPEITDLSVSGERATATVHWHFDNKSDQKQTTAVVALREDGNWKVCKA